MITEEEILNTFKFIILKFTTDSNYYISKGKYNTLLVTDNKPSSHISKPDINLLKIYATSKEYINNNYMNKNYFLEPNIEKHITADFFEFLLKNTPQEQVENILAILPKFIEMPLIIENMNKEDIINFFNIKKHKTTTIPSKEAFTKTMNLLTTKGFSKDELISVIVSFLNNYSLLVKRIETQTFLADFIIKHIGQTDKLNSFMPKVLNQEKSLLPKKEVTYIAFDKTRLMSEIFHNRIKDKKDVHNFINNITNFLQQKKKELHIHDIYIEDCYDDKKPYTFLIITESTPTINYLEIVELLIEKASVFIGSGENNFNTYKKILDHYFLDKKIKEKAPIKKAVNKI